MSSNFVFQGCFSATVGSFVVFHADLARKGKTGAGGGWRAMCHPPSAQTCGASIGFGKIL